MPFIQGFRHYCTKQYSLVNAKIKANLRWVLGLVIACSLTFAITSCNPTSSLQPVRIGINDWVGYSIARYAKSAGIFTKRGLDVELVQFNNQQDNIRATMRGSQDFSFVPTWELIQVDPANDNPIFVLVVDVSAGSDGIAARKGINSVKDLKGKQVATKLGTVAHLILLEALKLHQLQPKDVQIVDVSNERGSELLKQGSIDAAVMWQPLLSKTANEIKGKIIFTTKEVDSLVIDGLATRSQFLKEQKDTLRKFILAWFDAIHAVETSPDAVFEAIATQLKQPKDTIARDYAGLIKGDIALNRRMFTGRLQMAIQESIQLLQSDQRHGRVTRNDVEVNSEVVLSAIDAWQP